MQGTEVSSSILKVKEMLYKQNLVTLVECNGNSNLSLVGVSQGITLRQHESPGKQVEKYRFKWE